MTLNCLLNPIICLTLCGASNALATTQSESSSDGTQISARLVAAYEAEDFKAVIRLGLMLEKQSPGDADTRYRLACAYAMTGKPISSGTWLKRAAKSGFADFTLATTDPHLAAVRSDPAHMEAVKLIHKNQDRGLQGARGGEAGEAPLMFVPPGQAPSMPAPLIVLLHGYGTSARDILEPWKTTAIEFGALLVAPQATKAVNDGQGFSWESAAVSDVIISRAIRYVLKKYRVDKQRIVLSGFSQGGYLTYHLGMTHADLYCGLIPIAGRYDQTIHAASTAKRNQLPKVFIMVGAEDHTLESNRRAELDFKAAGISVRLNVYPDVGHHLPADYEAEFRKALRFFWPN